MNLSNYGARHSRNRRRSSHRRPEWLGQECVAARASRLNTELDVPLPERWSTPHDERSRGGFCKLPEQRFSNRRDAGAKLAGKLSAYAGRSDVVVIALPRGGVPVAYEVAVELCA